MKSAGEALKLKVELPCAATVAASCGEAIAFRLDFRQLFAGQRLMAEAAHPRGLDVPNERIAL